MGWGGTGELRCLASTNSDMALVRLLKVETVKKTIEFLKAAGAK